jgi:GrpB-like predicted nucleotidyltransferase (UPF0157 family)
VRIFRFDEEVSIPVSRFGSRIRLGPLTGEDSLVRAEVMYLPAGGLVGRHPAAAPQLFAVVAGTGWVSGAEQIPRPIGAGYAAWWDTGEAHEAGSEDGMTAICIEGEFEITALAVTRDIIVSDYDEEWPGWFEQIRQRVWPAVSGIALRVEHVGSTAVPGLAAKPIIDLDVVVAQESDVEQVIDRLASIGYRWRGDLGVVGRQAFKATGEDVLPPHHLYLVVENNRAHLDHVLLRDLLRADPKARAGYAALKRANLERAAGDIDVYVAAKAAFVAELLARARRERGLPAETYWEPDLPIG